jgi:uncharacterized surface protein with fasciclin (FAS1) repeats
MKKALKSAVVVTFAVVLSFALGTEPTAQAGKKQKLTILEKLCSQDGTQVLCASITVVDTVGCPVGSALLDDKKANLTLLAPSNSAFEYFLNLRPGTLEAWDVVSIARMLPGILASNSMDKVGLCNVLRRHVSVGEKKKDKAKAMDLLDRGHITVEDGSDFPVAIGGGRGGDVCFNFDSCVTERDVQTQNGVIHYLHKVLEEPPAEEQDPPPLPEDSQPPPSDPIDVWCSRSACAEDAELKAECVEFMNTCLLSADKEGDIEGCWASGLFKCSEREGLFGGDGLFDDDGIFD